MEEARVHSTRPRTKTASAISSGEAALWERLLLDPVDLKLSSESARYILNLRFPEPDIARMHALAEKARAGTLALDEHIELDIYERVGHVLSLIKSKARKALKKVRSAN